MDIHKTYIHNTSYIYIYIYICLHNTYMQHTYIDVYTQRDIYINERPSFASECKWQRWWITMVVMIHASIHIYIHALFYINKKKEINKCLLYECNFHQENTKNMSKCVSEFSVECKLIEMNIIYTYIITLHYMHRHCVTLHYITLYYIKPDTLPLYLHTYVYTYI